MDNRGEPLLFAPEIGAHDKGEITAGHSLVGAREAKEPRKRLRVRGLAIGHPRILLRGLPDVAVVSLA